MPAAAKQAARAARHRWPAAGRGAPGRRGAPGAGPAARVFRRPAAAPRAPEARLVVAPTPMHDEPRHYGLATSTGATGLLRPVSLLALAQVVN